MNQNRNYISIVSKDMNIVMELPKEFKSHVDIFQHEEFKEFFNKRYKNDTIEDSDFILKRALSGERITVFSGNSGKSMFEYLPEFIKYYNAKKRIEKIHKILNN